MNSVDRNPLQKLGRIGWLSEQPVEFRDRVAGAGRWTSFARGQMLYSHGDEATAIFGLGDGLLDVSIPINSEEDVVIYRGPPGLWIGDSGVMAGKKRTLSLMAAVDSRVFRISSTAVQRLIAENPGDWIYFAKLAHQNGTLALNILAETLALPPRARFARMLLRLATVDGAVHATQAELGRMAGMSRAAFRRAFGDVISSGAVTVDYGGIRIVDRPAIEAAARRS